MDVRAAPPAAGRESFGQHLHHGVELRPRESSVRVRRAHALVQGTFVPLFARRGRHDLLGQDVERLLRDNQTIEPALARGAEHGGTFDQLVPRQREHPPFGNRAQAVPCPPHALQQRGDRSSGTHLDDQIDAADVDSQLERRGGDQRLQLAPLQPLLCLQPFFSRQAAVMARDAIGAEPFGQMHREAFAQPTGVYEHQRRAVLRNQLGDAGVDLFPHFRRHHRLERRRWNLERQIEGPDMAGVDDRGQGLAGSYEELRDLFDRPLCCRQADSLGPFPDERVQSRK